MLSFSDVNICVIVLCNHLVLSYLDIIIIVIICVIILCHNFWMLSFVLSFCVIIFDVIIIVIICVIILWYHFLLSFPPFFIFVENMTHSIYRRFCVFNHSDLSQEEFLHNITNPRKGRC
jgi:hypothetical protein